MTRAEVLLEQARKLAPALAERSVEVEELGYVPDDLVAELRQAGFFRMWLPRELGGDEIDVASFIEIIEALAVGDGSTAWTAMIGAGTALIGAYLPEGGAHEVFSDPDVITGGALAPKGTARRVEAGWLGRGRWPFASGSRHCSWLVGGCVVVEDGRPVRWPDGSPVMQPLVFRSSDVTIVETWDVIGLRGTGSNDMAVTDVFVPDHLAFEAGPCWPSGPLYRIPMYALLGASTVGVVLGIARAALDVITDLATNKAPVAGGGKRLAAMPHAQEALARAEAGLGAARAYVLETAAQLHGEASDHGEPSLRSRALLRVAISHAMEASASAVDAAFTTAGGSSVYRSSPLQRYVRDIHTATQHVLLSPPMWTAAGKVLLGVDTEPGML